MKMKMLLAAGVAASMLLLTACASGSNQAPKQTPAQVAANVCPLLTAELDTLSTAGLFTGGAATTLNKKIGPAVDAVCQAGATVTQINVQTISSAAVPLLIDIVNASSLPTNQKTAAILAIGTARGLIDVAFPPVVDTTLASSAPVAASAPQ
ncbi:hypothetical protein [Burkholderia gladioli]|uniref:hypothetical protein n=1 Tax=Burkholderia gladioli TaxID=28095 RepID=UPI00163FB0E0|nr:hypothetical protein [Burkholderia gladioli]